MWTYVVIPATGRIWQISCLMTVETADPAALRAVNRLGKVLFLENKAVDFVFFRIKIAGFIRIGNEAFGNNKLIEGFESLSSIRNSGDSHDYSSPRRRSASVCFSRAGMTEFKTEEICFFS